MSRRAVCPNHDRPGKLGSSLGSAYLRSVECAKSSLVEVRRVFWVTDELCQDAHPLDEEWPDLVDLHRTKARKLYASKKRGRWEEEGDGIRQVHCGPAS